MAANNEVGMVQPLEELGLRLRQGPGSRPLFHTDAVQAVGKIPTNVKTLGVDLLSLSSHKIYGPKGVGALFVRKGTTIDSLIHGGGHEGGRRAGTENVPGLVGLGKAAELVCGDLDQESERQRALTDHLWTRILGEIPDCRLNGDETLRLPNTLNVSFPRIEGESAMLMLDNKGIALATGSACSSGEPEPSHALLAMGVDTVAARGALRFSLGRGSTRAQIDEVMEVLPGIIERLREMSPL